MTAARRAMLAIDEGTTGTRSAWVTADGEVGGLEYRRLTVDYPAPGAVEQDAAQILAQTVDAVRATVAAAADAGIELVGLALTQQRLTAVVWDARTGEPLAPALVWQDSRHTPRLLELAEPWYERLFEVLGRPAGFGSPYLWAAELVASNPEVAAAHERGTLRLGTIDSWILHGLTQGRVYATSATNASAAGAYATASGGYYAEWVRELGLDPTLLPQIHPDQARYGTTSAEVVGVELPILAVVGDQQAGAIGMGSIRPGQVMCIHGTGSFVATNNGTERPAYRALEAPGAIPLVAWRDTTETRYYAEGVVPTTGASLEWACGVMRWFDSPQEVSALAAQATSSGGVQFLPALAGIMTPAIVPTVTAALSGVTAATTREQLALALLEGVAHCVVDGLDANALATGRAPVEMISGGGLAASGPLLQAQADLSGLPVRRFESAEVASLRGAAFLAGAEGLLWGSLEEAAATLGEPAEFEPSISEDERTARREAWRRRLAFEIEFAR